MSDDRGAPPAGARPAPSPGGEGTSGDAPSGKESPPPSDLPQRIAARRSRHKQRPKLYRGAVVVAGFLVTLAGVIMTGPVPGPGFLIIPVGLALLALEFDWAERLLVKAVRYADRQKRKASEASTAQKVASGIAFVVVVAAALVAINYWDPPFWPF